MMNPNLRRILQVMAVCAGLALGITVSRLIGSGNANETDQSLHRTSSVTTAVSNPVQFPARISAPEALRHLASSLRISAKAGRHPREDWRLRSAVYGLPQDALPDALDLILAQPNLDREFALRHLFSRWAEFAPVAALRASESLRSRHLRGLAVYQALDTWTSLDPNEALAYVEKRGIAHHHEKAMLGMLARADPMGALNHASSLEDPKERDQWIDQAIHMLAISDPEQAAKWTLENREGESLVEGMQAIVSNWGRHSDPNAALDYLLSLPTEFQSQRTFRELGRSVSLNDYDAGIQLAMGLPESEKAMFLSGMARGTARYDPPKAAALAESLPEGPAREQALSIVAREWAGKDLHEASVWIGKLPRGASRDHAVSLFASTLRDSDPEAAVIWASDIDSEELRERGLGAGLEDWLERDREEAEVWIQHNLGSLSDFHLRELLE